MRNIGRGFLSRLWQLDGSSGKLLVYRYPRSGAKTGKVLLKKPGLDPSRDDCQGSF